MYVGCAVSWLSDLSVHIHTYLSAIQEHASDYSLTGYHEFSSFILYDKGKLDE